MKNTTYVDDIYESLTDGQRCHLLNKLGKHGYDARTEATIRWHKEAYEKRIAPPELTHSIGDRIEVDGKPYILAQVGFFKCALISLEDGNRCLDPLKVSDVQKITQDELDRMQYNGSILL